MEATFINAKNAAFYLSILPQELAYSSTVLIGVQDEEGTGCGVLAANEQDKMLKLLYIYVHPDYRGLGAGTEMLSLLREYALQNEFFGIQARYPISDETMRLWKFLDDSGFEYDPDEVAEMEYRIPVSIYEKMIPQKKSEVPEKLVYLEDMDNVQRNLLVQYTREKHQPLPGAYNQQLSLCAFDDNELKGAVLISQYANKDLEFMDYFMAGGDSRLLARAFSDVFEKIYSLMGEEVYIRSIPSVESNDRLERILNDEHVERTELAYQLMAF